MKLVLDAVTKRYGGVVALNDAHLEARSGEVHGLLGPNGSGKSTFNKILAGSVRPNSGTIAIDGVPVSITSPRAADALGIAAAYQQLSIIPELTVEENLLLGVEPSKIGFLARKTARARALSMFERLRPGMGSAVLTSRMGSLTPGQQQMIEIGKVLLREPRILILDEATASLHSQQVALLFELVREQRDAGTCILFVSHRLDEIMEICDRATILRAGRHVATVEMSDTSPDDIVRLMVGTALATEEKERPQIQDSAALVVDGLDGGRLHDLTFTVRHGEVLGLGGLQGQGQSELLLVLFGALPRRTGTITLNGTELHRHSAARSARRGIALVPGDRSTEGMFAARPIQENLSIASLWRRVTAGFALSLRRERRAATEAVDSLAIAIGSLSDPVSSLSGGNAQKVIVAKWLMNAPDVILLDDPTKGVDVGAKAEIYAIVRRLAEEGKAVVINSSEDRELATLCDRVLVMYEGRFVSELSGRITEERLVSAALRVGEEEE